MATSMRPVGLGLLSKRFSVKLRTNYILTTSATLRRPYSTTETSDSVEYPPIKPKYPPGKWGKLTPKKAWEMHEQAQDILQEKTAKLRLEKLAGDAKDEKHFLHSLKTIDLSPNTLPFKQYVTKTHTIDGLPELYSEIDYTKPLQKLRSRFIDCIEHLSDQYDYFVEENLIKTGSRYNFGHNLLGHLLGEALMGLSATNPHLLRSQHDSKVRLAAFFKRGGYDAETARGKVGAKYGDILTFQMKQTINHQIRTELSLPEILPIEDPVCNLGEVPDFKYNPKVAGQLYERERPISVSGHCIGDPCEFGHLTGVVADTTYDRIVKSRGESTLDEDSLGWGMVAGFGSTVAQAHNQGFFYGADITYPFVTQVVVTDGQWFRFYVYQLNTLLLWKDDQCHPTRNVMWSSPRMRLYDVIEDGRVKGLNDDVLKQLVKCLLVQPQDRGIDMRPHLPHDPSPLNTRKHINFVGEEPIPQYKPGRFEYPQNAVYF